MHQNYANIILVGPMGAGKTTIGKQLAREAHLMFVDSDHVIEQRCGCNIPWIFDVEGEPGFRARERCVIHELSEGCGQVIATGGGAVLDPENRLALKRAGLVVFLHASVRQQFERTRSDRSRPLLQTADPQATLAALMDKREPIYREIADIIINTERRRPRAAIRDILQRFKKGRPVENTAC